jgi:hypothetical protein
VPRARSIADRERDAQAVVLRARGIPHRQIAKQLGWNSPASAVNAINRALQDTYREKLDDARRIEEDKLDDLTRIVWREISRPHFVASTTTGKVVVHPGTGEPMADSEAVLRGVDRLIKIAERRAKLRGLDAPVRAKVEVHDGLDAEIEHLVAELAAPGSGGETSPPGPARRGAGEAAPA